MGAIPLFVAARLLFPVLLQVQQNPPDVEWGNVLLTILGILSAAVSAYAVWVSAKAYRERKNADLQMEESRRKTIELEARIKEMEREGKNDSDVLAGMLAMAESVRQQSAAMTARAEAQDRERGEWRSLIDTQTMTTAAMTNEIRRQATAIEHIVTLMQEESRALKRIDTRMGSVERKLGEREDTVKEVNATLKEIRDELRELNIALTTSDGAAIAEIRRQVNDALAKVEVKLDKVERLETLLERLEAQQAATTDALADDPPIATVAAVVVQPADHPDNKTLQRLKTVPKDEPPADPLPDKTP